MRVCYVVLLTLLLSGCMFMPRYQTPFGPPNPLLEEPINDKNVLYKSDKAKAFVDAYVAAKAGANPTLLSTYLDTGITYSHLLCRDYFQSLTYTKSQREFAKRGTNLSSGLASTALGLAKASAASIAATGALFSFSESAFDAYDESFLITPEVSTLERLVLEKQRYEEIEIYKKLSNVDANAGWPDRVITLAQAERALSEYIYHCTPNGMRLLLNDSIQKKTESVRNDQGQAEPK